VYSLDNDSVVTSCLGRVTLAASITKSRRLILLLETHLIGSHSENHRKPMSTVCAEILIMLKQMAHVDTKSTLNG
jgi:hypothetical protein